MGQIDNMPCVYRPRVSWSACRHIAGWFLGAIAVLWFAFTVIFSVQIANGLLSEGILLLPALATFLGSFAALLWVDGTVDGLYLFVVSWVSVGVMLSGATVSRGAIRITLCAAAGVLWFFVGAYALMMLE